MLKNSPRLPDVLLPERILLDKIWGGRVLAERLGLPSKRLGETWECFDRGSGSSARVSNFGGVTLHEICSHRCEELLGSASLDDFGRFPLMLKLLDATQRLSLQVHPDDRLASDLLRADPARDQDPGKTEAWVVLDAREGAELICGYHGEASDLVGALESSVLDEALLVKRASLPGDVVAIPPGTVHAVGAGYVLYEIQQNSDITLRLYDWGRVGDDGKPRALHLEDGHRAIDAADSKLAPEAQVVRESADCEVLVQNERFELRRMRLSGRQRLDPGSACALVTAIEGVVRAADCDLSTLETCILVPGRGPVALELRDASATLLVASPAGGEMPRLLSD